MTNEIEDQASVSIGRLQKFASEDNYAEKICKILVIEDNPILVKLYSMYLKEVYYVDVAYNGYDALKKITKTPPHLILLDIMMPGLDGFTVAQQMHEQQLSIPTIVLTVKHLNQGEIDMLNNLGITSFFQKDEITQEQLLEEINKCIVSYYGDRFAR